MHYGGQANHIYYLLISARWHIITADDTYWFDPCFKIANNLKDMQKIGAVFLVTLI